MCVAAMNAPRQQLVILVIPISDSSLKLHRLIVDHFLEFGESGGITVWWRPIASPNLIDPIYRSLRTPAITRRDQNNARRFVRLCNHAGSEDNYCRGEYRELARRYGIPDSLRPAIVLAVGPESRDVVRMPISPSAFDDSERSRELMCFLKQELSEKRIIQLAGDNVSGVAITRAIQNHANEISRIVNHYIARGNGIPIREWDSSLKQRGLVRRYDPKKYTTARAWRRDGNLHLCTTTRGKIDGEVVFERINGLVTRQMSLMWQLLVMHPRGVKFTTLVHDLYEDEITQARNSDNAAQIQNVVKRLRTLIGDIRNTKLEPAGINPDILPYVYKSETLTRSMHIILHKLDRQQLGHLSEHQY